MPGLVSKTRCGDAVGGAISVVSGPNAHPDSNSIDLTPAVLDCWTFLDGRHRVLLNRQGQLAACSDSTRQFLERSADFRVRDGRLEPADAKHIAPFRRLHSEAFSEVRKHIFPMKSGEGHWICQAAVARITDTEPLIGLTIQPATPDHAPEWPDLREALHLTDTEHKLLIEFLYGRTPQAMAANHKLSINTVRTHFRHIYEKLDVANMHDLGRKLLGYRVR